MANLHESGGQDVLEEAAYEFHGVQRRLAPAWGVDLAVAEGDLVVVIVDDAAVGEGDAEDVGGEIPERCAAVADGLGVDRPGLLPDGRIDLVEQAGPGDGITELGAVDEGEGLDANKEVRF